MPWFGLHFPGSGVDVDTCNMIHCNLPCGLFPCGPWGVSYLTSTVTPPGWAERVPRVFPRAGHFFVFGQHARRSGQGVMSSQRVVISGMDEPEVSDPSCPTCGYGL